MGDKFEFQGHTTFINKPRSTVIRDFQKHFVTGDNTDDDSVSSKLANLIRIALDSKDLPDAEKEEVVATLHTTAELISRKRRRGLLEGNALTEFRRRSRKQRTLPSRHSK